MLPKVTVVNKKTWRGEGIYVGRPTPLGNPFSHQLGTVAEFKVGTRDEAVDRYGPWLMDKLDTDNPTTRMFVLLVDECERSGEIVLVCHCKPERCHADVIKGFIESYFGQAVR